MLKFYNAEAMIDKAIRVVFSSIALISTAANVLKFEGHIYCGESPSIIDMARRLHQAFMWSVAAYQEISATEYRQDSKKHLEYINTRAVTVSLSYFVSNLNQFMISADNQVDLSYLPLWLMKIVDMIYFDPTNDMNLVMVLRNLDELKDCKYGSNNPKKDRLKRELEIAEKRKLAWSEMYPDVPDLPVDDSEFNDAYQTYLVCLVNDVCCY